MKYDKQFWRERLPLITEWCNNEDALLTVNKSGPVNYPTFQSDLNVYAVTIPKRR